MKYLLGCLLIAALLTLPEQSFGEDAGYASLTDVNVEVVVNGEVIHQASLLLLDNKKASIVFSDEKTKLPLSKILVMSSKDSNKKKGGLITLNVEYLTFQDNTWKSETKSSVLNESGKEGMISLSSDLKTVDMFVTASSRDNEILKTDPVLQSINRCDSQNTLNSEGSNCCSTSCKDGSGKTLSCCNVVSCSNCGAGCSPSGDVIVLPN